MDIYKLKAKLAMPANLTGQIEKITFTNEENGFTIARVKVGGSRGLVTVGRDHDGADGR